MQDYTCEQSRMPDSRFRLWLYIVVLATGSVLLFLGGPDYYSARSFKHFWNIGHIIYFALMASLLSRWHFVARRSLAGQWAMILVITLFAGVAIELAQYGTAARTPDMGDVLRDLTGSLLLLVFGAPGAELQPAWRRRCLQAAVLVLLLVQLWPLTRSLIDEAITRHQFPLLSTLETPFEIHRWAGSAGRSVESVPSVAAGKLLRLSLTTDRFSGTVLDYFYADWRLFRKLEIDFYNPDENPLQITCRIHDLRHVDGHEEFEDRFNRNFLLTQGWNTVEIDLDEVAAAPVSRDMDMSHIRGLGIYVVSLPEPRILYLDNVRLSR